MKVGVISDTHGNAAVWREVVEKHFKDVELIIHAGDILYHGPRNPLSGGYDPAELAELINSCPVPVVFAKGNCDSAVDQMMLLYPIQSPYAFVQLAGRRLIAHHGDGLNREEMISLARRYRADVFISGHTHVPVLEEVSGVILLNPGSPTLPKGDGTPTVALLESTDALLKVNIIDITGRQIKNHQEAN